MTPDRATFWITKSGRSRTIPLTARARDAVFSKSMPGGPFSDITYPRFLYDWNATKKSVGLNNDKQIVPHILRHTCASRLVQAGIDLRRVQAFLGHQTIQMTLRYAHLATNDLDQCVQALERFGDTPLQRGVVDSGDAENAQPPVSALNGGALRGLARADAPVPAADSRADPRNAASTTTKNVA